VLTVYRILAAWTVVGVLVIGFAVWTNHQQSHKPPAPPPEVSAASESP
jgi:hypothetical protein